MRLLYYPFVNWFCRTSLRPVRKFLPEKYHFPIEGRFRISLPEKQTLVINSNPTCYIAKVLFWEGYKGFEYGQFSLFKELVKEARVFVDVGANVGYYSLLAATYNPSIRVYAFEPLPNAVKYIEKNIAANGFNCIETWKAALSDHDGEDTFYVSRNPKFYFVSDQLTSTGSLDKNQGSKTSLIDEIRVETLRLDSWVAANGIDHIDLLKLDTEATEHIVLSGAHRVLGEHQPIIFCEVLPGRIEDELNQIFSDFNYLKFRIDESGVTEVDRLRHDESESNDHVMVHRDQRARLEKLD